MKRFLLGSIWLIPFCLATLAPAAHLFVEAESFEDRGGWSVETQFVPNMGSPYLLAHGLGHPVTDAATTVTFPARGSFRVFVRTMNWVGRWSAPGEPGRFQVLVNGAPLPEIFGTKHSTWTWHAGGTVSVEKGRARLGLHDLTGFDGRCDALFFTDDPEVTPPNDPTPAAAWRQTMAGLPKEPLAGGDFDLVVVGGGYAGMCSALAAARLGCKVALVQDRPVLGGNGSSEIRVWPQGLTRRGLFPHLGEIVEELADRPTQSPGPADQFNDARREAIVRAEANLRLFLGQFVFQAETDGSRIAAVRMLDCFSGRVTRLTGRLYVDGTGHGTLGVLAGAAHSTQRTGHMGMSNMWRWRRASTPRPFPETPWALPLSMKDFPYPERFAGEWFWESGFDLDPVRDLEAVRDWNLRAVFGAFNAMKNGDGRERHLEAELEWVSHVGGNRESRQLLGDVVLTGPDIVQRRAFPDACVVATWDIDLHYPDQRFTNATPENPFVSKAAFGKAVDRNQGYAVPYRCFYSTNVGNLFMAGRCVSVTHEALGSVRVMKTGGMMGEVVGRAAALCLRHGCSPREVYAKHWDELARLLNLPGNASTRELQEALQVR